MPNPRNSWLSYIPFDIRRGTSGIRLKFVHEDHQQYITTRARDETGSQREQRFVVDEKLWHSTALVGDCTVCWRVKNDDHYIIKDSWVVGGSGNEGSLLKRVSSKKLNGLIPIVSHEDVIMTSGDVDCISNIRPPQDDPDITTPPEDRVHTRTVMCLDGKARPLESFNYPVIGLHDAIEGHRNLYEHGILCRDVTPFNILIQPDAPKGRGGILFNLHCAVGTQSIPSIGSDDYIEHLLPTSLPDTLGSRAFQSCRVLATLDNLATTPNEIVGKNHYTDDLESFYYVLRYLVVLFPAPGLVKFEIRHSRWFTNVGYGMKLGDYLNQTPQFTVTKTFGEPVRSLLQQLHAFLRPTASGILSSPWRPVGLRDYTTFSGLFRDAIEGFPGEETQDNVSKSDLTAVDSHTTTQIIPLAREADGSGNLPAEPQPKRQKRDNHESSIAHRVKLRSKR